jgi:hypothetical protein
MRSPAEPIPFSRTNEAEGALKRFLQGIERDKGARYAAVFADLNGDGAPEAIVYLVSQGYCGSGGCTTFVLSRDGNSWRIASRILVTHPAIRILEEVSHGWHSLAVFVAGGGIIEGYKAQLDFDGSGYPLNPTVPPARRLTAEAPGTTVIGTAEEAKPLY